MLTHGRFVFRHNAPVSEHAEVSPYDSIASLYDRWNTSVVEDIGFYCEEALASGEPVLELGVGTGRIAIPIAQAGVRVIGVDSSAPMLERCREQARTAGVAELLDLRLGDLRDPSVAEKVALVISPFRAFLHLLSNEERRLALTRIRGLLRPRGRLVFDVFAPSSDDVSQTHGRWIEREPEIFERADWDVDRRRLTLRNWNACAAALKILEVIEREKLDDHARKLGGWMKAELERLAKTYPHVVKNVRGLGFMLGFELVEKEKIPTFAASDKTASLQFVNRLHEAGVLTIPAGAQVIRLLPPLNLKPQEAGEGISKIEEVVKSLA